MRYPAVPHMEPGRVMDTARYPFQALLVTAWLPRYGVHMERRLESIPDLSPLCKLVEGYNQVS